MRPRSPRRGAPALLAAAAMAAAALVAGPAPATAADEPTAAASPAAAKPGAPVRVTGSAPACGNQPFHARQIYTDADGNRVEGHAPAGGIAGPDGSFRVNLTVPADATRSNIFRPFGEWQYFTVVVEFPGCEEGLVATDIEVLSVRKDQRITISPAKPRSGQTARVRSTNCVGGVLPEFTWVIDRAGSYFMIEGETLGTTFTGTVDLARGFRGDEFPTGPAVPSRRGETDAAVGVPCTQSEGPRSVAEADKMFQQSCVINVTILPANGQTAPPPRRDTASSSSPSRAAAADDPPLVREAPRARPLPGRPTYTG